MICTDALDRRRRGEACRNADDRSGRLFLRAWKDRRGPVESDVHPRCRPDPERQLRHCHRAGEVAPFPLTSYEDAAKHAKQMAKVTDRAAHAAVESRAGLRAFRR